MEVITGFKAKTSVYLDENDFLYTKHKEANGRIYLRCYSKSCKSRAVVVGERYKLLAAHNDHSNHHSTIVVLRFRERLRRNVDENPDKLPKAIFEEAQLEDANAATLVSYNDVRSLIFKTRAQLCPTIPKDLAELASFLDIERYCLRYGTEIAANQRRLYSGLLTSSAGEKSVLFTSQSITAMCRGRTIQVGMDATFKVVPRNGGAYQLFGIHFLMDGTAYPIVFALMQRKTTSAYVCIIDAFNRLCTEHNIVVESVVTDYESALRAALVQVMPTTIVVGCYFHYARAVYMRFKADGLTRGSTSERRLGIKMLMSIALLPNANILEAIELVRASLSDDRPFQQFCRYMVRQWGNANISVYGQAVRTNNSVESFHKYLFSTVGRPHPNIWLFLKKLAQVEHTKSVQLSRRRHGEELVQRPRASTSRQDERIAQAQRSFNNDGDVDKFLRDLSRAATRLVAIFEPADDETMPTTELFHVETEMAASSATLRPDDAASVVVTADIPTAITEAGARIDTHQQTNTASALLTAYDIGTATDMGASSATHRPEETASDVVTTDPPGDIATGTISAERRPDNIDSTLVSTDPLTEVLSLVAHSNPNSATYRHDDTADLSSTTALVAATHNIASSATHRPEETASDVVTTDPPGDIATGTISAERRPDDIDSTLVSTDHLTEVLSLVAPSNQSSATYRHDGTVSTATTADLARTDVSSATYQLDGHNIDHQSEWESPGPRGHQLVHFDFDSDNSEIETIGRAIRADLFGESEAEDLDSSNGNEAEEYLDFSSDESLFFAPVQPYAANEAMNLIRPCQVCLGAEIEYTFVDCGHFCVCAECANQFEVVPSSQQETNNWRSKCPKCREIIRNRPIRIFF